MHRADEIELAAGPSGTVMMVLGAANEWDWVNAHPESERAALPADADPFDPARGRLAGDLLRDLPWDDYYGPGPPHRSRFVKV